MTHDFFVRTNIVKTGCCVAVWAAFKLVYDLFHIVGKIGQKASERIGGILQFLQLD